MRDICNKISARSLELNIQIEKLGEGFKLEDESVFQHLLAGVQHLLASGQNLSSG